MKYFLLVLLNFILQVPAKTPEELTEIEKNYLRLTLENAELRNQAYRLIKENFMLREQNGLINNTLPKNCAEAAKGRIGVFQVKIPDSFLAPFPVYCDRDNWMVILRRVDGTVDFQREWSNYKEGFGDIEGNFIMGLEKLHQITKSQCHELKVLLEDFANESTYAYYDKFKIGSESRGYALKSLGRYSGTAGDGLDYHRGRKFTTIDRDNDLSSKNCAIELKGGWWFHNCTHSKLTGLYLPGGVSNSSGIEWYDGKRGYYSYKLAEMMIRPTVC